MKVQWRRGQHRGRRAAVWAPGDPLVIDWGVEKVWVPRTLSQRLISAFATSRRPQLQPEPCLGPRTGLWTLTCGAGFRLTITVAGRPAAILGPVSPRAWRHWGDLAPVFSSPTDPDWAADRHQLEDTVADPWGRR